MRGKGGGGAGLGRRSECVEWQGGSEGGTGRRERGSEGAREGGRAGVWGGWGREVNAWPRGGERGKDERWGGEAWPGEATMLARHRPPEWSNRSNWSNCAWTGRRNYGIIKYNMCYVTHNMRLPSLSPPSRPPALSLALSRRFRRRPAAAAQDGPPEHNQDTANRKTRHHAGP